MKKFNIEQTEKDRILSLHESVKNKTILNEQELKVGNLKFNKALQMFLNEKIGGEKLKIDGFIQDKTKAKIEQYQELINNKINEITAKDKSRFKSSQYDLIRFEELGDFKQGHLDLMKTYMGNDYSKLVEKYKQVPFSLF